MQLPEGYVNRWKDDNIDYEDWFNQQKEDLEQVIEDCQLEYQPQKFDDIVEQYKILTNLKGVKYEIPTKMVFYTILSNTLKHNYFYFDGKRNDLRIPILFVIKAGHGKKVYAVFISKTIKGLQKEYNEPTRYHPDQLVGKVLVKDKGKNGYEYFKVYGTLAGDFVLFDDAHLLLTSKNPEHYESLKHIRTALDPIGFNELEKKQVNIPYKERLHYFPICNVVLLSQPIQINEELVSRGSFRRFVIVKVDSTIDQQIQALDSSKFSNKPPENFDDDWSKWINFNIALSKRNVDYIIHPDNAILINEYIKNIVESVKKQTSKEVFEYLDTNLFSMELCIFRMASIRAIVETSKDKVEISKQNVMDAIADYNSLWKYQVSWIAQHMVLTSDRAKGWKDSVHGFVLEKLSKEDLYKSELVDKYLRKYVGTYAPNTLKSYIYPAINKCIDWYMVEEYIEAPGNDKILRITEIGRANMVKKGIPKTKTEVKPKTKT